MSSYPKPTYIETSLAKVFGYTEYMEYRKKWRSCTSSGKAADFPLELDIDLKDSCNLRCPVCLSGKRTGEELSIGTIDKIIEELSQNQVYALNFGNTAEPFCTPELLFSTLKKVRQYTNVFDIFIHTNGVSFSPAYFGGLKENKVTHISFSLDAYRVSTHKKLRGGNFEAIKENIFKLIEYKKQHNVRYPFIRISCVCHDENIAELEELIKFWKSKVDLVEISQVITKNGKSPSDNFERMSLACGMPWRRLAILPNGKMYPCCSFSFFMKDLLLGDVRHTTIKEVWNSPKAEDIRLNINKNDKYKSCFRCRTANFRPKRELLPPVVRNRMLAYLEG